LGNLVAALAALGRISCQIFLGSLNPSHWESADSKLDLLMKKVETTNKEIFEYCTEHGFRGSHGKDVLLRLKKEGKVSFDSKQPGITYDKCYRENVTIKISKTGRD
jgi:hypothetical protein